MDTLFARLLKVVNALQVEAREHYAEVFHTSKHGVFVRAVFYFDGSGHLEAKVYKPDVARPVEIEYGRWTAKSFAEFVEAAEGYDFLGDDALVTGVWY